MSNETEAFEIYIKAMSKHQRHCQTVKSAFCAGHQAATAHYQPLLDAKDAEIARLKEVRIYTDNSKAAALLQAENTTLKALLEQAREALGRIAESEYDYMTGQHSDEIAEEALAAINAATGEK